MNIFKNESGELFKILYHCYNVRIVKYYGLKFAKYKNDILLEGCVALYQYLKDNNLNNLKDADKNKLLKSVDSAMDKYIYNLCKNEFVSLDLPIDDNNLLSDFIVNSSNYFDSFDFDFLNDVVSKLLHSYGAKDRKILNYYFFRCSNIHNVCKIFNINRNYLSNLVCGYRKKLVELLMFNGYDPVLKYIQCKDEFEQTKNHKDFCERQKAKKKGKTLFNVNDYFIYKLIRQNTDYEVFARCLNISVQVLKDIVLHKSRNKLFLYEIQALRKLFFSQYSLSDLVEVKECCI